MESVGNIRNPLPQVVLEEILQLCGKLYSGWPTPNNNLNYHRVLDMTQVTQYHTSDNECAHHVKKAFLLLGRLILEHGCLNAVHHLLADLLRVTNLLQEACMLLDTWNAYQPHRLVSRCLSAVK
jgi:hypothetical protein